MIELGELITADTRPHDASIDSAERDELGTFVADIRTIRSWLNATDTGIAVRRGWYPAKGSLEPQPRAV